MTDNGRPLDGGDEQIVATGNGPDDPQETVKLRALFGDPVDGVYAPNHDEEE